jgi:eukaryotic-like serine/threonine-protein kinase
MSLLSTEETERRAQEQVGRTLNGKYRLDALLGVGGMAAVYSATHRNGNRVAIKLLHPELTRSSDVLARFIREGYAANRVGHPGAVRVLDDVRGEDGSAFLVMELLEGDPVDVLHAARDFRIAVADLMPWMNQLLDVLAAAHEEGIVHRDIKPENLFITRGGTLKVLDFGIARMKSAPSASATRTGNQFGTPPFMSPEQALGRMKEIDARSDLYSVGATMFYLLTGQDVHPAESANEMLVLAATKPARALLSVAPDVPAPLALVVDRALTFHRDDRWPDARSMQAGLQRAHVEIFGEPLPPLPALPDSGLTDPKRISARSLQVKATSSSSGARSAETQAAPSSPDASGPRREFAGTAPPTSTVANLGGGSRRWLFVAAATAAVALGAATFVLRGAKTETAPAAPAAGESHAAVTPPPPPTASTGAGPASAPSTAAPIPNASAAQDEVTTPAVPHASAAAAPASPPIRRKAKGAAVPRSGPGEASAFEHQ